METWLWSTFIAVFSLFDKETQKYLVEVQLTLTQRNSVFLVEPKGLFKRRDSVKKQDRLKILLWGGQGCKVVSLVTSH